MTAHPSFIVEDQSATTAFLEARLAPQKRIDTHGAVVFLTPQRAYKLKRAVKFPYMDFSTVTIRRAMCAAEVEINSRLAPEIYLGVAPILKSPDGTLVLGEVGQTTGDAVDWLVVMRRFDEDGLLDRMAMRGALTPVLMAALGARVAAYHNGLTPLAGFSGPDDYRRSVAADIRQLREQGDRLDPVTTEALAVQLPGALEPFADLVARRAVAGAVRRCHGDLHLRNIVLIDGQPVPFDAIEFSERIASIDVLYDLAFALMDLCDRNLRPLANRLLNEWLWRIAELPDASHEEALALLPHFLSRRAAVRAFVEASGAALAGKVSEEARTYQRQALAFLQPQPPRLLAIGGLSGSGKTTQALKRAPGIGRTPGAVVVRSDVERKRRAGLALEDRMPAGSYTAGASAEVYTAMLVRAERVLRAGYSVVLDAVFARPEERAMAEALAARVGVPFEGIWLDVPKRVAMTRVAQRKADASDATPAVVERQFGYDLGNVTWRRE
ncbi:MAG: AAA family ATPase [Reyranella sp.]|uniref:bifunctional aminoglycoside phosphotransferase/ATP-binding protein n=1 Tax=Reyranella sp. TaxID=1929291 RepID=UPI003D0BC661